jgi:hypothetical protein
VYDAFSDIQGALPFPLKEAYYLTISGKSPWYDLKEFVA